MKTLIGKPLVLSMLTLTLAGVASPGFSLETAPHILAPKYFTRIVRIADLDLASTGDLKILYDRLKRATSMVCKDSAIIADPRFASSYKECYTATLGKAVIDVNLAALSELHADRLAAVASR